MLHMKHPYVPVCFGTFSLNAELRSDSNSSVHSLHNVPSCTLLRASPNFFLSYPFDNFNHDEP